MPASIISVTPTPESDTIHPSLNIVFSIQHREDSTIPISITGIVRGEDNRTLGNIFEVSSKSAFNLPIKAFHYLQQRNPRDLSIEKIFRLTLDQKALEHIEHLRERNKKGDVIIGLDLNISYLDGRMEIGGYAVEDVDLQAILGSSKRVELIRLHDRLNGSNTHLRMLVPSGSDYSYLNIHEEQISIKHVIHGSDWINDFQPQLGIGKFLVIEIPEIINVSEPKGEIEERLHSASQHLLEIRESIRSGEWEQVAEDCRGIYEDLRKNFQKEFDSLVQQLLRDDNGISDKGIGDFMKMIEGQNGFIHEFHHIRDQEGKVKKIVVHKEDAYALYISLVGLVNMLTTKYHRLKKIESK